MDIFFPEHHPSAAGHFPSNPIIPGALILDEVIATLPGGAPGIRAAKFFHPLRPGERLRVRWVAGAFECHLEDGTLVASGSVETPP